MNFRRASFDRRHLGAALLGAALLWAYWPTLAGMAGRWWSDTHYNHGFVVPLFAAALLWLRRDRRPAAPETFSWRGLPLLALGGVLYLSGAYFYYGWFSSLALLPWLAGVTLLFGGWPTLRWAGPSVAYLFFLVPLPYSVQVALGGPLQRVAALASTYVLQSAGFPAQAEGNVIVLNDFKLDVVEACSGLGMLLLFFAVCTAAALVSRRALLDRALMVVSAVPIAVACNVVRIAGRGAAHELAGARVAEVVFHDLAAWLMMPLALVMLWLEMALLSRLFVVPKAAAPLPSILPAPAPRLAHGFRRG